MNPTDLKLAAAHLASGARPYEQHIRVGRHEVIADEPVALGGADAGLSPYGLVIAGLAACTSITLQMYAARKGWQLGALHVDVTISRDGETERIDRVVKVAASVTPEQRARLAEIAEKTPVTKTLKRGTAIETTFATALLVAVALLGACAEEQHPDDPLKFNERGLRQSPEKGEGLGDDKCANGCPDPDTDGDGIIDDHDACPKAADTDPVDQAFDGCPNSAGAADGDP